MSREGYIAYAKKTALGAVKKQMAKLGTIWVDPELPDDWESITQFILVMSMSTIAEYQAAQDKLDTISVASQAASSGQDASTVVSTQELEEAQNWLQNTTDWWEQTWSGDLQGGSESFGEGWDSFWSGKWF